MKKAHFLFILVAFAVKSTAFGQGTVSYIYDQQSATNDVGGTGTFSTTIYAGGTIGQSFVPTMSSVGFIRLSLVPTRFGGVTAHVNLWSDEIGTGTLLASTDPVFLLPLVAGYPNFYFPTAVTVVPNNTYFVQLVSEADRKSTRLNSSH